jgi:hypothetical protein
VFQGRYQQCGSRSEDRGWGIAVLTCRKREKERLSPAHELSRFGGDVERPFFLFAPLYLQNAPQRLWAKDE